MQKSNKGKGMKWERRIYLAMLAVVLVTTGCGNNASPTVAETAPTRIVRDPGAYSSDPGSLAAAAGGVPSTATVGRAAGGSNSGADTLGAASTYAPGSDSNKVGRPTAAATELGNPAARRPGLSPEAQNPRPPQDGAVGPDH